MSWVSQITNIVWQLSINGEYFHSCIGKRSASIIVNAVVCIMYIAGVNTVVVFVVITLWKCIAGIPLVMFGNVTLYLHLGMQPLLYTCFSVLLQRILIKSVTNTCQCTCRLGIKQRLSYISRCYTTNAPLTYKLLCVMKMINTSTVFIFVFIEQM